MAWSKYNPNETPTDHNAPHDESAARRAWILRWGWRISQGMFFLGVLLMAYFTLRK